MFQFHKKKKYREKTYKWKIYFLLLLIIIGIAPFVVEIMNGILEGIFQNHVFRFDFHYVNCLKSMIEEPIRRRIVSAYFIFAVCGIVVLLYRPNTEIGKAEVMQAAKGIWIPVPAGNGEFGTARFMEQRELDSEFGVAVHFGNNEIKGLDKNVGIIVNFSKRGKREYIHYLNEPVNTIVLGATRSGKTRRTLFTSTWLNIVAGINLLIIDVKGEIFAFTNRFAEQMGYEVRTLDFRFPEKSMRFNNMEEINQLLKQGEITKAVNKAWDIVSILVGEPQGERIWNDGQCATIAAAILIVAQDAPEECKNLTNVYYFLAYMCESESETGDMPITQYLENLTANHPARGAFQIAKIAPFRTRSSFFTSALATLRLFTDWNVADITSSSDYVFSDIDEKKVITYLILPDEKTTFHPIGAIYMKQLYESLVEQAIQNGGRLKRKFIYREDEIGNFPKIPDKGTMLSAGAGRNIFYELILQDYQQLENKYKDDFRNIRTNCQLTICLRATDEQTTKTLSSQLGNYTIETKSASASINDGKSDSGNYSKSKNLTGRPLLYPDEIAAIEKPDALILYGGKKAITQLPDLSIYAANQIFGMGDEEYNMKLYLKRMAERPSREIRQPNLWGIWEDYEKTKKEKSEKITFL